MSRAYIIYILMFAALAGGLWVVIELGEAMRAPDDLSGEWTVAWKDGPVDTMRIDQSGRFFNLRLGNAKPISMTLQPGWKGASDGPSLRMNLAGNMWRASFSGTYPPTQNWRIGQVDIELIGPTRQIGTARRLGAAVSTRPAGVAHAR
jgi:hypothetical protein